MRNRKRIGRLVDGFDKSFAFVSFYSDDGDGPSVQSLDDGLYLDDHDSFTSPNYSSIRYAGEILSEADKDACSLIDLETKLKRHGAYEFSTLAFESAMDIVQRNVKAVSGLR